MVESPLSQMAYPNKFRTFKRTCRNWRQYASARKMSDMAGLTYDEARRRCEYLNAMLTPQQKRRGTRYEFEQQ
jgi:hypothetical protein